MSQIYLLRHCDYANPRGILPGRLPVELSEAGRARTLELREIFQKLNISKIYSSAVLRCKQTAELVSGGAIPIVYDQRLLETLSAYQGYWLREDWDHFFAHQAELGGETLLDIRQRVVDFYEELIAKLQPEENVVICSHGDPLQQLFAAVRGLDFAGQQPIESKEWGWLEKGEFVLL